MNLSDLFKRRRKQGTPEEAMVDEVNRLAANPGAWETTDPTLLAGLLLLQCMHNGIVNDPSVLPALDALYRVVMRRLPVSTRLELVQQLALATEQRRTSIASLFPFLFWDEDTSVVSTATLNAAVLTPLEANDPLTGPKSLLRMASQAREETRRVSVYSGLLMLGDRRVVELMEGCWEELSPAGRQRLAGAWSGTAHAPVVDFFVTLLETAEEGDFGAVAGALARLPLEADPPFVVEVERKLPVNGPQPGPEVIPRNRWSFDEYGQRIAPRLLEIASRESEPRLMPLVLSAWGISSP